MSFKNIYYFFASIKRNEMVPKKIVRLLLNNISYYSNIAKINQIIKL